MFWFKKLFRSKQERSESHAIVRDKIAVAIFNDDPESLHLVIKNARKEIGESELRAIRLPVQVLIDAKSANANMPWWDAVVCEGAGRCIQWALKEKEISPLDYLNNGTEAFGYELQVRQVLWSKVGTIEQMNFWKEDAKKNQKEWTKLNFLTDDTDGIEWLYGLWLEACMPPIWKTKISLQLIDKVIPNELFKLVIAGSKSGDSREEIVFKPGWSENVCKTFIDLGWCSKQDMLRFQKDISFIDKTNHNFNSGYYWYRPGIVNWIENTMLKEGLSEIGIDASVKKKQLAL